jgi:hypothetical protein
MQIGKDIERYDWYYNRELISEVIIDRQNKEEYHNSTRICKLLNQQDQRISELEEQLKKYEDLLGITKQEPLCYLSTLEKLKVTEEALARILRICGTGDCEIKNKFIIEQFEKLKEDLDLLNTFISENAVGVFVDVNEVKDKINNRIKVLQVDKNATQSY